MESLVIKDEELTVKIVNQAKESLKDLTLFLIFLISVTFVCYGYVGTSLFLCSDMLNKLFVHKPFRTDSGVSMTFAEVTSVSDFWTFTETVLIDVMANNDFKDQSYVVPEGVSRILNENVLMGGIRLRQLRVRNDSCESPEVFWHLFTDCYDFYSESSEDQQSFGLKKGTAWKYQTSDDLEGYYTWTGIQIYPGGGYIQDLGDSIENNRLILRELHDNGWLNRGTRVVFIEFTIYNPNVNVITTSKLIAEILPTGSILTSTDLRPLRFLKFTSAFDYFLLIFEVWMMIQIIFYTVKEAFQVKRMGWKYFVFWNCVDIIIVCFTYVSFGLSVHWKVVSNQKIDVFNENPKKYVNFDVVSFWQVIFFDFLGILSFFVYIRLLKYINFNKTMLQFGKTLRRCAKDIAGFGVMFIIVFVAYAQLGFILFGSEIYDFRSFLASIFTLLRTILGDFDYLAIERANRALGPIYFLSYIFIVFFVLLNMFLAIINETYTDIKATDSDDKIIPVKFFLKMVFQKIFKRNDKGKSSILDHGTKVEIEEEDKIGDFKVENEEPVRKVSKVVLKEIHHEKELTEFTEKIESIHERVFALEYAVDQMTILLNDFIKKQDP